MTIQTSEPFKPTELIHIWKCQPCEAGDTLSGGDSVKKLVRLGLIHQSQDGYMTTQRGNFIVQRLFEYLDKLNVSLSVDVAIHTPI